MKARSIRVQCFRVLIFFLIPFLLLILPKEVLASQNSHTFSGNASGISREEAVIAVMTKLEVLGDGYRLHHPQYTACFSDRGISFIPSSRKNPWQWHLKQAGPTGRRIQGLFSTPVTPVAGRKRHSVSYNRGQIIERYIPRMKGLEQQFVIMTPLPLEGNDLVIAGAISGTGEFEEHTGGWLWRNGKSVVSLGDVYTYDSSGKTIPARMTVSANESQIVVDGKALARAAYPVTIDPEIGTNDFRISDMGTDGDPDFDAYRPAVAYNSVNREYLVVWEGDDNTGLLGDYEPEIFGQRINAATGEEVGANDFRISSMGTDDDQYYEGAHYPDVVYNSVNDEYLVVWEGNPGKGSLALNEYEIFGQRINGATGAEVGTNDFRISDMGPDGEGKYGGYRPAVAFNSADNEYLVVWQGLDDSGALADYESEIFGQRINGATGAEVGTNDFRISDMGTDGNSDYDAFLPDVAYNSADREYLVVWQGDDSTWPLVDDEFEIFGQRINAATGAQVGANDFRISETGPVGNAYYDALSPAVAYNSAHGQYLVVWHGSNADWGEHEIFGQRINAATGAEMGDNDFRISDMGEEEAGEGKNPAVAYNSVKGEFVVTWKGVDQTGSLSVNESEIFGQRIKAATGQEIGTNDFRISDMGPDGNSQYGVAYYPSIAFNSADDEYLVVWDGSDDAGSLVFDEFEIYGQRFSRGNLLSVPPSFMNILLLGN